MTCQEAAKQGWPGKNGIDHIGCWVQVPITWRQGDPIPTPVKGGCGECRAWNRGSKAGGCSLNTNTFRAKIDAIPQREIPLPSPPTARARPHAGTGTPRRSWKEPYPLSSPSTPQPIHRHRRPRSTIRGTHATDVKVDVDVDAEEKEEHFLFTEAIWNLCKRDADNVKARRALGKAVSKVARKGWNANAAGLTWYRSACLWLLEAE